MQPKFKGTVKDGRFIPEDIRYFTHLRLLEGKQVNCVVSEHKIKTLRSINQNKYYWSVVVKLIAEVTGYNQDETHEVLKQLFLSHPVVISGKNYTVSRSTTSLTTVEMEEYLEQCRGWASTELSCSVPEPNEVSY